MLDEVTISEYQFLSNIFLSSENKRKFFSYLHL